MSRYVSLIQLLLAVLAGVTLSTIPLAAEDAALFAAFPRKQLENCSKDWPPDRKEKLEDLFRTYEGEGIDVLTYLIVPRWMIDSSERKTSESTVWGMFEPTSANPGVGYVKPLNPSSTVVTELENSFAQGALRDVYGEDVAVLDDFALRKLFRLCQFNKDSPFDSSKLRALKNFTQNFLVSERKWFLSPEGNGRMIFISELRQKNATLVRVVIPVGGGSVLSFPVVQTNRAVLRDMLRVLNDEEIPVTITFPIAAVNILSKDLDLKEIARLLDVRLMSGNGDFIGGFDHIKVSGGNIYLFGIFLREALDATSARIELSQSSPYRLVWKDEQGVDRIGSAQTFKLPAQESEVDAPPLQFNLAVAHLPTATRLRSEDIWHHEVSFGEAQISRDLAEIKERQASFSADLKEPVDTELLFTDPLEYVRSLGSRIGRKILGLEARDQRVFAQEMAQTDRALEALWEYLQIAKFISKEHVEVVVVKNVPSSIRRWRWTASADRMSSWVTSYLDYRIQSEGQSGISIREVEAPAQEDHIARSVSILLVPQQEKEKLP
jgi:hypothetical protein